MNLDFKNPVFHNGINVTCRRGYKWLEATEDMHQFPITDEGRPTGKVAVIEDVYCSSINGVLEDFLKLEHDPVCHTKEGLTAVMKATYGEDFSPDEECTWLAFTVEQA